MISCDDLWPILSGPHGSVWPGRERDDEGVRQVMRVDRQPRGVALKELSRVTPAQRRSRRGCLAPRDVDRDPALGEDVVLVGALGCDRRARRERAEDAGVEGP